MRSMSRLLLLLIATLILKGWPVAYALPVALESVHAGHQVASTSAGQCSQSAGHEHCTHHEEHASDKACQIACDLGTAPAIHAASAHLGADTPRVEVAILSELALTAAAPPDHPPPIR